MTIPLNQEAIFAYGEFGNHSIAIHRLAGELRESLGTTLSNKQNSEALARLMMLLAKGSVEAGPYTLEWRKSDTAKSDLYYTIKV